MCQVREGWIKLLILGLEGPAPHLVTLLQASPLFPQPLPPCPFGAFSPLRWETALHLQCRMHMVLCGFHFWYLWTQADLNREFAFPRKINRLGSGINYVLEFLKAKEELHLEHIWDRLIYSEVSGILYWKHFVELRCDNNATTMADNEDKGVARRDWKQGHIK